MKLAFNPNSNIFQATGNFSFENAQEIFNQLMEIKDQYEKIIINFNHLQSIHLASIQALIVIKSFFGSKFNFYIEDNQMLQLVHRFGLSSFFNDK